MSEPLDPEPQALDTTLTLHLDAICDRFEAAWKETNEPGQRPVIDEYLGDVIEPARSILLGELLRLEIYYRRRHGERPQATDYSPRFSSFDPEWLRLEETVEAAAGRDTPRDDAPLRCPHCQHPMQFHDACPDQVLCPGCGSTLRLRDARFPSPTPAGRPLGKFQLLERVGLGAFGAVWRARDTELDRLVALKIPHTGLLTDGAERERFHREARAAAQLRHPGIVTVHEVQTLDGQPTIVADFIDGVSLRGLLEVRRLRFREAAELVADVAEAVDYAHSMGLVHRDLKPANIMIDQGRTGTATQNTATTHPPGRPGKPLVMDFGLALRDEADATLTLDGHIIGTPAYMSPEQAAGKGHQADRRSDVYSLGVVFYELLTGELPFRGSRMMLLDQVLRAEPRPPRKINAKIPRDLETICLKAMAKLPEQRYPTAREMAEDLRRYLAGEPVLARRVSAPERLARWCQRNPSVAGLLAAVALSLVMGTAIAMHFAIQAGANATQAYAKEFEATQSAQEARENEEKALQEKTKADAARALANRAREEADAARSKLRENLYFAEMNLAGQAAETAGGVGRVEDLLRHWLPQANEPDRRGWEWFFLKGQGLGAQQTLHKHTDFISSVRWSPDGLLLAAASASRTGPIRIWDTTTGRHTMTLQGPLDGVRAITWRPDGRQLASAGVNGVVKIWDAETGVALATLRGDTLLATAVSYSPDGRYLLSTGYEDKTVRIWQPSQSPGSRVLQGHTSFVTSGAWSPDGRQVASTGYDRTVRIWDAATGKEIAQAKGHNEPVRTVSWSPDGHYLASAGEERIIRIWDVRRQQEAAALEGHEGGIWEVSWSPGSQYLASAGSDQTVRIWDVASRRVLMTLRGHSRGIGSVSWSRDGRRLASGDAGGTVRCWDVKRPEAMVLRGHENVVNSVSWAPDGRSLVSGGDDHRVKLWNVVQGEEMATLHGHQGWIAGVGWSPNGRWLVTTANHPESTARLWDPVKKQEIAKLGTPYGTRGAVSWSPDSKMVATAVGTGVWLWDPVTRRELARLDAHTKGVNGLSWSPDGRRLASASADNTVGVWDVTTKRGLSRLQGHTSAVADVAWSPDGRQLASASHDQTIRIWDTETFRLIATLQGHSNQVLSVSWSPDGQRLASGGEDHTIKIWDATLRQECCTLRGHSRSVTCVRWSPDGLRLASSSADRTVRIWDATPGYAEACQPSLLPMLARRLESNPKNARDLHLRAEIQSRLGRWEDAAADWLRARALQHGQSAGWFQAGWWVLGPLEPTTEHALVLGTEPDPMLPVPIANSEAPSAAALAWQPMRPTSNGCLDMGHWFANSTPGFAYALVRIYSRSEQQVAARLGGACMLGFWHNGQLLHGWSQASPSAVDEIGVPLTLRAGWNTLLFKIQIGAATEQFSFWLSAELRDRLRALADCGRWQEAATTMMEAVKQHPDQPSTLLQAARLFRRHALKLPCDTVKQAQAERQAEAYYLQLTALRPHHLGYLKELAEFRLLRGSAAARRGDWLRACADFARVIHVSYVDLEEWRTALCRRTDFLSRIPELESPLIVLEAAELEIAASQQWKPYVQNMYPWGAGRWMNDRHVFYHSPQGGYVEFKLEWPESGRYQLTIFLTQAPDFGKLDVALDGTIIGQRFDGFKETVEPSGKLHVGIITLSKGSHRLRFSATDKNPKSRAYYMGIERFEFRAHYPEDLSSR